MAGTPTPITDDQVTVVPANEASWEDIRAVFGTADAGHCQCQRFKVLGWIWRDSTEDGRTAALRAQTACDTPDAPSTSGLVAYVDGEPAGWVAVEPRTAYPKLRTMQVPWLRRDEDKADDTVWAARSWIVWPITRACSAVTAPDDNAMATVGDERSRAASLTHR
jgi:hypothetical protein